MSLRTWLFGESDGDDKYRHAIDLADEVTQLIHNRTAQKDPLKAVLVDLLLHQHDTALVADAFEISQESRIYRGVGH